MSDPDWGNGKAFYERLFRFGGNSLSLHLVEEQAAAPSPIQAPTLIVVLATLTMAGAIFNIYNSFVGIANPSKVLDLKVQMTSALDEAAKSYNDEELQGQNAISLIDKWQDDIQTHLTASNYKRVCFFSLIGNLAILTGAFLIRRMRRSGFHLYLGGKLVFIIGVFATLGTGLSGWAYAISALLFGIIVGGIYTRKLKLMS